MKTGVELCARPDMHIHGASPLPSCGVCSAPASILAYKLRITAMTESVLSSSMQFQAGASCALQMGVLMRSQWATVSGTWPAYQRPWRSSDEC